MRAVQPLHWALPGRRLLLQHNSTTLGRPGLLQLYWPWVVATATVILQFGVIAYLLASNASIEWQLQHVQQQHQQLQPAVAGRQDPDYLERAEAALFYFQKEDAFYSFTPQPFQADKLVDGKLFLSPPEAETIEVAQQVSTKNVSPVIIRAQHARKYFGHVSVPALINALKAAPDNLTAYFKSTAERGASMHPALVAQRWLNNQSVYINDCPTDLLRLPEWLAAHNGYKAWKQGGDPDAHHNWEQFASIVLNMPGAYTPVHHDPPAFGGGWMYVAQGEKHWVHFTPLYMNQVRADWAEARWWEVRTLYDPSTQELADMARDHPKGPLWAAVLRDGDFMLWPPGSLHKVHTPSKFIGLSSYWLLDGNQAWLDVVQALVAQEARQQGQTGQQDHQQPGG